MYRFNQKEEPVKWQVWTFLHSYKLNLHSYKIIIA